MIREAKARALAAASTLAKAKREFVRELRAARKALSRHPDAGQEGMPAGYIAALLRACSDPEDEFYCDERALREEIIHAARSAAECYEELVADAADMVAEHGTH